jgi:predicted Zn-dependent protease with MMP-like domain
VIEVTPERFEELVAEALDGLPPELGARMDNVAVFVEDRSTRRGLLGLYQGVPLTARGNHYGIGGGSPDRITIFRENILARCRTEQDVVRQVTITVVHEVAHHFGIDDARLRQLGWG